ncbi:Ig-like domain-containing protein [Chloroflexi bacterium TSY]|nr:Ig-like domain-containing protein [Chloroflexi bacterium TSY]
MNYMKLIGTTIFVVIAITAWQQLFSVEAIEPLIKQQNRQILVSKLTTSNLWAVDRETDAGSPAALILNTNVPVLTNNDSQTTVMAQVRDAVGNPVKRVEVTFQSNGGRIQPVTVTTNAEGVATSTYTANGEPGQVTITASAGDIIQQEVLQVVKSGVESSSHTLTLEFTAGNVNFDQQTPVSAILRDASGQPIVGELITFFGSLGIVTPASGVSNTAGHVTITYQAGRVAGNAMITALSGVVSKSVRFQVAGPNSEPTTAPPTPTVPTPTPPTGTETENNLIYLPFTTR